MGRAGNGVVVIVVNVNVLLVLVSRSRFDVHMLYLCLVCWDLLFCGFTVDCCYYIFCVALKSPSEERYGSISVVTDSSAVIYG